MRHHETTDTALLTMLTKALEQRPIIADGSPLTAAYAAFQYDMPEERITTALNRLVREGIARREGDGYLLTSYSEVSP